MPRLRARRPSVAAARRAVRRAPRPWVRLSDEELLKAALLRPEALHRALAAGAPRAPAVPGAGAARPAGAAARVAVGGMVLSGRRAGHRRAVLPGAPAPRAARAAHHARGRGRQHAPGCMRILRHEAGHALDNAYRLRRRKPLARGVRPGLAPVSGALPRARRQPPLRAPPRRVVRAGAPHRGFRRDLRGVAEAEVGLAQAATPAGRRCTSCRRWTSSWRACAAGARRCATAR